MVNHEDRVVGQAARSDVHAKGLLHRAVHVFLINPHGQLYLQRRSLGKDSAPGKWTTSCSGHVDAGEDYDFAARRELSEELGLKGDRNLQKLFALPPSLMTGNEFVWVYACFSDQQPVPDPIEIMDGTWVSSSELERWIQSSPEDFAGSFLWLWPLAQCALHPHRFQPTC